MSDSVPLKEHFEKLLLEKDKAIDLALADAQKWRDNANEWRAAMNDKDKLFMTKAEFLQYKEAAEKALALEKEKKSQVFNQWMGWLVAIIIAAIGLAAKFL